MSALNNTRIVSVASSHTSMVLGFRAEHSGATSFRFSNKRFAHDALTPPSEGFSQLREETRRGVVFGFEQCRTKDSANSASRTESPAVAAAAL